MTETPRPPVLQVGDRVWYVIPGLGQIPPIWLKVAVVKVTATRIGVRSAAGKRPRYVAPARLMIGPPPPGATTLVFDSEPTHA